MWTWSSPFTFWSQFIFTTLLPTTRLHTLHALVKPNYSFAESLPFDSSRLCSWFLKCSFLLSAQVLLAFQGPNSASPLLVKPPVSPFLNCSNAKSVLLSESTSLSTMASSEVGTYLRPAAGLKLFWWQDLCLVYLCTAEYTLYCTHLHICQVNELGPGLEYPHLWLHIFSLSQSGSWFVWLRSGTGKVESESQKWSRSVVPDSGTGSSIQMLSLARLSSYMGQGDTGEVWKEAQESVSWEISMLLWVNMRLPIGAGEKRDPATFPCCK